MARRKPAQVHGLLVVDKPAGMTSHDVVDKARRILGERKIGHSGTLDPDATGVLLLGVGDATRLLRFLDNVTIDGRATTSKSYTGTVVLGTETTTLDASGEVTATYDMSAIIDGLTIEKVQAIVDGNVGQQLLGDVMQVPPMVSALKVDGKRLHELAREGIEIEREARPVTVHSFTVVAIRGNEVDIDVTCSSGTYIRTLAADLGTIMGGGAHLKNLRRTSIGRCTTSDAVTLDELQSEDSQTDPQSYLRPVIDCVRGLSRFDADAEVRAVVAVGKVLPAALFVGNGPAPWAVVDADERLIAVYEPFSNEKVGADMARPSIVLITPESS
ncbi:MAG: tRNA pseudouridine(55) synthase TruB [Actinomycetota bacterium]|nr:tRNA pseudouridine(55) synthase TruB [Actinomycetota bacterium]MDA3019024.1 tRNA pseudouridine(55) synthase TruB [Actinomycetota bacterium]